MQSRQELPHHLLVNGNVAFHGGRGSGGWADARVWRQYFDFDGILMSFSAKFVDANFLDRASPIKAWSKGS